ncbi:MAG: malto-oligosyltrehalose trehalohydrolase [Acidimicrobiales bacterium]
MNSPDPAARSSAVPALGASPLGGGRTRFVVWAPRSETVSVRLGDGRTEALERGDQGYHHGVVEDCPAGSRYRYVLHGGAALADPASRHQPEGVLGPSEVVDLAAHRWRDDQYRPLPLFEHVLCELHVGTASAEGTLDSAVGWLDHLVDVGITAIELLPISQFAGARNWGYDGVLPFSVQDTYGGPAALQRFVDECHGRGLAVILDVVYNHIGPVGNVLGDFGPYFTERYTTAWGPALNFDGRGSDHVRAYFLATVTQWFVDFHVDALRLDAIHSIVDGTATPFLAELTALSAHLAERLGRPCPLIAESADNDPWVVTPRAAAGLGMDAQWNDDFHHALHGALTGERMGYYVDFGQLDDLARAINGGFTLQGEHSEYRGRRHGAPSGFLEPERFVIFAQNHDQIGNRPRGERLSTLVELDRQRLAAALVLLAPGVPLLFMGEEYGETAPFPYFVDHRDETLNRAVREGRAAEMRHFGFDQEPLDPVAQSTFAAAVPDRSLSRAGSHRALLELHRRLIAVRRREPALARSGRSEVAASVAGPVLTLSRRHPDGGIAALFNVSGSPTTIAMPALATGAAPPGQVSWRRLLDSADPDLGGQGKTAPEVCHPGEPLELGPWAFCLYRSDPARPAGEP